MTQGTDAAAARAPTSRELVLGVGRAFGGSLLFVLPILMTMEMWRFGMVLPPLRLAVWVGGALPLLTVLARSLGFRDTAGMSWRDYIADGFVAYGVGVITTVVVLALFDLLNSDRSLSEMVGLIAIESVPASIGAVIARGQFGAAEPKGAAGSSSYPAEILLMAIGAAVFSFNVAPTEEVLLIATVAGPVRGILLALLTMLVMHAVVYLVGFRGEHRSEASGWSVFYGYTVAGYATALLVSLGLLWTFGRTNQMPVGVVAVETVVLGLPAGVGAAAARLIL
ncbi:MAG TPA: TIGR02587 family membrane protein [Euzebyales bacterium]